MSKETRKYYHSFFLCFMITVTWCVVIFLLIALTYNIDLAALAKELPTIFYRPHHNNCTFGKIGNINVVAYIYLAIIISAVNIRLFRKKIFKSQLPKSLLPVLQLITCAILCIILTFQTAGQIKHLAYEYKNYTTKPANEKYYGGLKTIHEYTTFYRQILPGKHSAQFISDMDTSKDPGMFTHRALAYYLYPIDIRNIRQEPKDSLIIFEKINSFESVPDDFKIIAVINKANLLAIKPKDGK